MMLRSQSKAVEPTRLTDIVSRLGALIRHNSLLILREPGPLATRMLAPLVMISVLVPLYRRALTGEQAGESQTVAGMLTLFSMLALSIVGVAILTERAWRTWDRLRATAAASWELLLAKAVPSFCVLAAQQALILVYATVVIGLEVPNLGMLVITVLVWVSALLCIGTMLGAVARSHNELAVYYDVGGIALAVLGGALMPVSMMPAWLQAVAPLSPGYWAMAAFRAALSEDGQSLLRASIVLLLIGSVAAVIACWRITRGWGRSRLI